MRTTFEAFLAHADGYIAEPDRSLITMVDNVVLVLDVLAIKTTS
jgi:hypothetical protein